MANKTQDKIRMISSAGTGHFYTTQKNKKNTPEKFEFMKYDPVVRKHVMYRKGNIRGPPSPPLTGWPTVAHPCAGRGPAPSRKTRPRGGFFCCALVPRRLRATLPCS